jgi:lipid A 3-O-deacylase
VNIAFSIPALLGFALLAATTKSLADGETPGSEDFAPSIFCKRQYEFALNSGAVFSPFVATGGRPTINYTITEAQLGYMLSEIGGQDWYRGNLEFVAEAFASGIFKGSGSYIAGGTLWLRYNFVPQNWRLIPFVQGGMGLTGTDIDRGIVGQVFNFNLEIGAGARVLLSRNWGASIECRYQHISNANTGVHNIGINSIGPVVGISYFF